MDAESQVLHGGIRHAIRFAGFGAAALVALIVGGVIAAIVIAQRRSRSRANLLPDLERSPRLFALRGAIVGTDKRTVAAALGVPHATTGGGEFLSDDTWFYPLDPVQHLALVIEFDEDVACETRVLRMPMEIATSA